MNPSSLDAQSRELSKRAASRLNTLLTDLGFSIDAFNRAASLSERLSITPSMASHLMSGIVPWSLGDISMVCAAFDKNPGFFLDPAGAVHIPGDSKVIAAEDGGEDIVWRSPGGFLTQDPAPKSQLRYINTVSMGYFGAPARTKLIFEVWPDGRGPSFCQPDQPYVLADYDGVAHPALCKTVGQSGATFTQRLDGRLNGLEIAVNSRHTDDSSYLKVLGRAIGAVQGY